MLMKHLLRLLLCALLAIFCVLQYIAMQSSSHGHGLEPAQLDSRCEVFFGILSAPDDNFWRSLMRNNWIRSLPPRYCYRFFIGTPPIKTLHDLEIEQQQYGDLVFLPMHDSYREISIKTIGIANWVRKHSLPEKLTTYFCSFTRIRNVLNW